MSENGKRSNFELLDEMEQKQQLTFKDETFVDPQPDGIRYARKWRWIRPDAKLTFPVVVLIAWFILWLTGYMPGLSWLGDICMVVMGIGIVGSIWEIWFKKKGE